MKCFYDANQDAVGTCKSCGRGISQDHLTDMGKGLACKSRCEEDVQALIALIDQNIRSTSTTRQILTGHSATGYGAAAFNLLIGITFSSFGYSRPGLTFVFYLGACFIVYGIWLAFRTYRYASAVSQLSDAPSDSKPAESAPE